MATAHPLTAEDVRRLRRAMADASTWDELLSLAQHIWSCPVERLEGRRPCARARLCAAYARAVDRLSRRRTGPQRRRRPRAQERTG